MHIKEDLMFSPDVFPFMCVHFWSPRLLELKLHLQLSFETEDSIPEEQSVDPDTPVALVPDQPMAPVDNRQAETGNENGTAARLGPPDEVLFDRNCTLSEKLKDMRVETRRYPSALHSYYRNK